MSWVGSARAFVRDYRSVLALRTLERARRRLVFYAEDAATWNVFAGHVEPLLEEGRRVVYVTSAMDDPLLDDSPPGLDAFYLARFVPTWLPTLDSDVFVTTMPDLDSFHIARPAVSCRCVYVFHSINSIHEQYNERAFHAYDDFFLVGPHHRAELEAYRRLHGLGDVRLHEVGYPKLDRIHWASQAWEKRHPDQPSVLIAPSWWKGNVLERLGETLIARLSDAGYRVIVRPHPVFFLSTYPGDPRFIDRLEQRFGGHPDVEIERGIESEDAFFEADVMISDHSGAALEYALGTARPVILFDVERKTLNPRWERLGLPIFEREIRKELGLVLTPEEAPRIAHHVAELLAAHGEHRARLERLRERCVYHFGESGEAGARVLGGILDGG